MKIDNITLTNYKQYKGVNELDLTTDGDKNLILIGGLNGYGKTNLMLAFVWCLYGEKIDRTDTQFRKQIHRDGNYPKFLKNNLNWSAEKKGTGEYSVKIKFSEINLPDKFSNNKRESVCTIERVVNVKSIDEKVTITIGGDKGFKITEPEEQVNFINDYIVPIDASKFIFFNAEKISQMAELSTREEGDLMNDALSNILGLDIYEALVDDLQKYADNLKKDGTRGNLKDKIEENELEEKIILRDIENLEKSIANSETDANKEKEKINQYENYIRENAINSNNTESVDYLYTELGKLSKKLEAKEEEFNSLIEIIPFAISGPILEEVIEQIYWQDSKDGSSEVLNIEDLSQEFVEKLFNKPEFPETKNDLTFPGKLFYAEKAKRVFIELLTNSSDESNVDDKNIIHDLTLSDKELLKDTYSLVKNGTSSQFDSIIGEIVEIKNQIQNFERKIKNYESDIESEEIVAYRDRKNSSIEKLKKLEQKIAIAEYKIEELKEKISTLKRNRRILLEKSELSSKRKKQHSLVVKYVEVLNKFIVKEKEEKSQRLSDKIYSELENLLHKLQKDKLFISKVVVKPLPDNEGLNISLIDRNNQPLSKESLSEGEKQLYISSLIKALLSEAVQDFPIIIDTPLGRLDQEHINRVLEHYYPNLANQVILMATDSEIPLARKKLIDDKISKTYILVNQNNTTKVEEGYFKI